MKPQTLTTVAIALLSIVCQEANAQNNTAQNVPSESSRKPTLLSAETGDVTPPLTTKEKVDKLQTRYSTAVTALVAVLNQIPQDPSLISSDQVVSSIDKASKEFDGTRNAATAILSNLKSLTKNVAADSSFTDEEKADLRASAEAMAQTCDMVSKKAVAGIGHLNSSNKAMAEWTRQRRFPGGCNDAQAWRSDHPSTGKVWLSKRAGCWRDGW